MKKCVQCGCDRNILIKAEVAVKKENASFKLNTLCVFCFLKALGLHKPFTKNEIDYQKAME